MCKTFYLLALSLAKVFLKRSFWNRKRVPLATKLRRTTSGEMANRNEMRVSGSDSYALLFWFILYLFYHFWWIVVRTNPPRVTLGVVCCSVFVERGGSRLLHVVTARCQHTHSSYRWRQNHARVFLYWLDRQTTPAIKHPVTCRTVRHGASRWHDRGWKNHSRWWDWINHESVDHGSRQTGEAAPPQAARGRRSAGDEVVVGRIRFTRHRDDCHQGWQVPLRYSLLGHTATLADFMQNLV